MSPGQPDPEAQQEFLQATHWLLEFLDRPRLVQEVREAAKKKHIPAALLRRASQGVPIIRRPRELRGPWTWRLPRPEELVRVSYTCPVKDCGKEYEGWMEFGLSRLLFEAGLVRYLTRGTAVRTQPPEGRSIFLRWQRP